MSILSSLENIIQRVEAPFKKPVSEIENFFKSLGSEIFDEENKILKQIGSAFTKDAAPLIQGIGAFYTAENADKIISNPLSIEFGSPVSIVKETTRVLENDIVSTIKPFTKQASNLNGGLASVTVTPSFTFSGVDTFSGDANTSFSVNPFLMINTPYLNGDSIKGGLEFQLGVSGFLFMDIGLNIQIDIPERGTFQFPSFGISGPGSKESLGQFQESEGVISFSGGVGFGGKITNDSDDSISLELDVSILAGADFQYDAQIADQYNLGAASIKKMFGSIVDGSDLSKIIDDLSLQPKFYSELDRNSDRSSGEFAFTPTIKASIDRKTETLDMMSDEIKITNVTETVDFSSQSNIKDALTGLEIELDINPALTASVGLILEEENTGVTLTALNIPFSLENKITFGLDDNQEFQIYDDVSADIGLNLQALGASVYKTFSLPGFVWDIGSIDESIGRVDLLDLSNTEGFKDLELPQWVPSGKLTFDGIELASTNF